MTAMNMCKRLNRDDVLRAVVEYYSARGLRFSDESITFEHADDPADTQVVFSAWLVVPQEPTR